MKIKFWTSIRVPNCKSVEFSRTEFQQSERVYVIRVNIEIPFIATLKLNFIKDYMALNQNCPTTFSGSLTYQISIIYNE